MLKRVLALPGQTVCRTGSTIAVDGIAMGEARERDSRGRPLPAWEGCDVVEDGKLFLMNWQAGGLFRRAILRNDTSDGCHRSRASRVDMGRLIVRSVCTLSAIPLFDRRRHHSSVPTEAVVAAARSGRPGRPNGRREAASPWTVASTVAGSPPVRDSAACSAVAAVLSAVLMVRSARQMELNRILSKRFAVLAVCGWEQGQTRPRMAREKRRLRSGACG